MGLQSVHGRERERARERGRERGRERESEREREREISIGARVQQPKRDTNQETEYARSVYVRVRWLCSDRLSTIGLFCDVCVCCVVFLCSTCVRLICNSGFIGIVIVSQLGVLRMEIKVSSHRKASCNRVVLTSRTWLTLVKLPCNLAETTSVFSRPWDL